MENPKTSAVQRLKEATNVLVTVSTNPSVDQLAGAIGLTLLLNKLGKHATTVFSGEIPSTIEFLQPEQTIEKNTDSLRDFIISLDKGKADKIRYKVEEKLVKIFITPYHTSLNEEDLEFSLGDFNVDAVVALGVHEQQDLDQAIIGHGRILHDATIITMNTMPNGSLGSISWVDEKASSLCEMLADLGVMLKSDVFDGPMATALLTGIVAETDRFSNQRTSSATMSMSAKLMAAGADQQLVATKLEQDTGEMIQPSSGNEASEPEEQAQQAAEDGGGPDGALRIEHDDTPPENSDEEQADSLLPEPTEDTEPAEPETGTESEPSDDEAVSALPDTPKMMQEPPSMGGTLTASGLSEEAGLNANPLSMPSVDTPLLTHNSDRDETHDPPIIEPTTPVAPTMPVLPDPVPVADEPAQAAVDDNNQTLEEIEESVDSPHTTPADEASAPVEPSTTVNESGLDAARDAVNAAVNSAASSAPPEPIIALGAQPVDLDFGHDTPTSAPPQVVQPSPAPQNGYLDVTKIDETTGLPGSTEPSKVIQNDRNSLPPPVPPPMMPPPGMMFGEQPLPNQENDNQTQDPLAPL